MPAVVLWSSEMTDRRPLEQYNHQDWEFRRRFLRFLIRSLGVTLLAKLDKVEGLQNVPREGPGILLINHIAFIDPGLRLSDGGCFSKDLGRCSHTTV